MADVQALRRGDIYTEDDALWRVIDHQHIKIWDKVNDAIVYDNQMAAADDADPTTALGAGSIVIHMQRGAVGSASMGDDTGSVESPTSVFLPLLNR